MMKKNPVLNAKQNQAMVDEYTQMSIASFEQDIEIWDNKVLIDNPVLCDGDGPINMVRKWYSQFYMKRDEIPTRLTERKEHTTVDGPSVEETLQKMHMSVNDKNLETA